MTVLLLAVQGLGELNLVLIMVKCLTCLRDVKGEQNLVLCPVLTKHVKSGHEVQFSQLMTVN